MPIVMFMLFGASLAHGQVPGQPLGSNPSRETVDAEQCASPETGMAPYADTAGGLGLASVSEASESLSGLAGSANRIRVEVNELATQEPNETRLEAEQTLAVRLVATADEVLALPRGQSAARVLLHLARSLALIDPELERVIDERSTAHHSVVWLSAIESVAVAKRNWALAAHVRMKRAELYERDERVDEALLLSRQAAFDAARASDSNSLYRAHWLIARVLLARGDLEGAARAYRSAVTSLEAMRASIVADASQDGFVFRDEVEPVYLGLVDILLRKAESSRGVDREGEQSYLLEARAVLEQFKVAELRDYFQDDCLSGRSSTNPDAIAGTVVVYPIVLDDRVEIIVSRDGTLSSHHSAIDGRALDALARNFRRRLEDRMTRGYQKYAEELYDALIRPIQARLAEAPVATLIFVPDGALRQVPITALRDRESGKFLVEQYAIAVVPSLTLTDPRRIDRSTAKVLFVGISNLVQGFAALPNVEREIEAATAAFPSRVLLNEDFRADRFEKALGASPFDIVHVASHGQFSSDPSKSFILTWNGRLSLARLKTLLGQARFRTERPIELLVLSACETAVGDDRASLGFAGVAVQIGARSVIATLWSVSDAASSELIARFYAELKNPSRSRADALQRAQVSMLKEDEFGHPGLWAPFVLISSWL